MSVTKVLNETGLQKLAELIAGKLAEKVDIVSGKGLSAEDFTTVLKTKLESIDMENLLSAADKAKIHEHENKSILDAITQAAVDAWTAAEANVIESVKVNGTALTADANKAVDVTVPTQVSDLTNDSGFQTASDVTTAIATALAGITGISFSKVNSYASLPATGAAGVIYFVPASGNGVTGDIYDEYVWIDGDPSGSYEKVGTSEVKFGDYWSKAELVVLTDNEVTTIFNAAFNPQSGD